MLILCKKTDYQIDFGIECFNFLGAPELGDKQVYLILNSSRYHKLIDWKQARDEVGGKEMWIQYVECWYPEDLPLDNIMEIIVVNIERDPKYKAIIETMVKTAKKAKERGMKDT